MSTTKAILMTAMVGVLGALTAAAGGYAYGLSTGQTLERGKADADAVQQLTGLLTSHKDLIGQANTASANLRDGMAARSAQDQRFSKEFRYALKLSAAARAGCRFDDDSLQQLGAARDRAAAATFGTRASSRDAAVPGTAAAVQR